MTTILTAAQIINAYDGYITDYKSSDEHKMMIELRNLGNNNRSWNLPYPEIVMKAKRELATGASFGTSAKGNENPG